VVWQGPPVPGAQSFQPFPAVLVPGLIALDALREEQALQPVHMPDAFPDEGLQFPAHTPTILFLRRRDANHRADPRFAPLPGHECAHQRLAIDPIRLGPAVPARHRDRGRVHDVAFDSLRDQRAVDPEPVQPGLLDHDHGDNLAGPAPDIALQIGEVLQQSRQIAAPHLMPRHPGSQGRGEGRHQPGRAAEFQRYENRGTFGGRDRRRGGEVGSLHGDDLH
jgi:hypothetical protein